MFLNPTVALCYIKGSRIIYGSTIVPHDMLYPDPIVNTIHNVQTTMHYT